MRWRPASPSVSPARSSALVISASSSPALVANVTFNLPHSRTHETEADRIGVELAARAGYEPHAAVSLWQKMLQAGGSGGPQFLSTHPSPENRLADLSRLRRSRDAALPDRPGAESA